MAQWTRKDDLHHEKDPDVNLSSVPFPVDMSAHLSKLQYFTCLTGLLVTVNSGQKD